MPKSKFIVITPYYKESERLLRRCIDGVAKQTIGCEHFLIADGFPQDWIDGTDVRHLKLDAGHADYGNTPRGVGALIAIAEGYEGIGLLDADNWLEPDHIEICLEAAEKCPGGAGNCDYVVASRLFRRPDETIMQISDEPDHVDTNCFFFFRGAFSIVPHWALMPKVVSPICDRIFYSLIKSKPLTSVKTKKPSVNYQTLWSSQYRALGETPPEGAKHDVDPSQIRVWADSQSSREVEIVNRLVGFSFLHDTAFVRARRSLEEAVSFQQRGLLRQSENAYAKTIEEYPDY
ncbi:MAG: hypothetical protein QOF09_601, partial [Alphaproteobacteria bacterium]|nr:hypothetical protein [Alphaproteobacteria bacterium]